MTKGPALQSPIVGGDVRRSTGRARQHRREHAAQRLRDAAGDITLQHQDVVEVLLVSLRPQRRLTLHVHQRRRDADSRRVAADAAFEQVVDAKFLPDLDHILARGLVLHRRRAPDDVNALRVERAQLRDRLVGDAIAEELVFRLPLDSRTAARRAAPRQKQLRHSRSRDSQAAAITMSIATAARSQRWVARRGRG